MTALRILTIGQSPRPDRPAREAAAAARTLAARIAVELA